MNNENYSTSSHNMCDMILKSRKTEMYIENKEFYPYDIIALDEGIDPNQWYLCIFRYKLHVKSTIREILRDCHHLLKVVENDGCAKFCPIMIASENIEYLCSCHSKTTRVLFVHCCHVVFSHGLLLSQY